MVSIRQPTLVAGSSNTLRDAFGDALVSLAASNPSVLALDGDVAGGTGAYKFRNEFPDRFVQCGIAEQNMVGVAAGLAEAGYLPFVCTFASFMLRGLDQVKLAVAQNGLPVTLVASHPGLDTGPDGASAQCLDDLAIFRAVPGLQVFSPGSPFEVAEIIAARGNATGPAYIRTGRSSHEFREDPGVPFRLGQPRLLREGTDVTIAATGVQVTRCLKAADLLAREGVSAAVFSVHQIKPLDASSLVRSANQTGLLVTSEDHSVVGGLGGAVAEACAGTATDFKIEINGVSDSFGQSGDSDELARYYGISAEAVADRVLQLQGAEE